MTDLTRLRVSLTKHNAHKVASLLKAYDASEVFARLDEVSAEPAQARKNLSTGPGDTLPPVWKRAHILGARAVDGLVLLAIVFSHHKLITAMAKAASRNGVSATIPRGAQLDGKEYTNFARILDQLGVVVRQTYDGVTFDLSGIFQISGLGPLFAEVLTLKLRGAGWAGGNSLAKEAVALGLHEVFGITPEEFSVWLEVGAIPDAAELDLTAKDRNFFDPRSEGPLPKAFVFRPGHDERDVDPIVVRGKASSTSSRLHNDIQNRLYLWLAKQYGAENVGSELDTGSGTSIDVAARQDGRMFFYEIKTGTSVRANIRQALPQLLEYAHWIADARGDEFVIVSHLPVTEASARYLNYLRTRYGIPLTYRQFDMGANILI